MRNAARRHTASVGITRLAGIPILAKREPSVKRKRQAIYMVGGNGKTEYRFRAAQAAGVSSACRSLKRPA